MYGGRVLGGSKGEKKTVTTKIVTEVLGRRPQSPEAEWPCRVVLD